MKRPNSSPIGRRPFHVAGGLVLPLAALLGPYWAAQGLAALATLTFWSGEVVRFSNPTFNRWLLGWAGYVFKEHETFRPTGSTYLLSASLVVLLFFDRPVALLALFFLALSDPVAGVVGQAWGRKQFFGKSWEGGVASFLTGLGVGAALNPFLPGLSLLLVVVGAGTAAVAELLPLRLDDNITVPLFSAGAMALVRAWS